LDQSIVNRRYRIDRLLGEGGMAEVYLGHDLVLQRPVAIKKLRPQYARDPNFRARFEREAQAAASFTHPNIIDIYDVGEEHGTPYIVMEYVPGDDLAHIIAAEGPFDPDDVAALVEQVAAALDYAHQRGFVHRDIKPHNILVDDAGLAKVVDFGIAKGVGDSDLTEAGEGLGTVHYISPEQASGLMATPSSDTYSLGVIAYEMLTGQLPFDADTPVGIAMQHISNVPTHPSDVNPDVPRPVGDVVMRTLDKNPTTRFPSASAFAEALTHWRTFAPSRSTSSARSATTTVLQPQPQPQPHLQPSSPPTAAPVQHTATMRSVPTSAASARPAGAAPAPMVAVAPTTPGCVSWLVGITMIAALGVLIWFGFQLAPRLGGSGDADPTRTPSPPTEVASEQEQVTNQPTSPAIVPRDTEPAAPTATSEPMIAPALTGLTLQDAQAEARKAGIELVQRDPETSDTVEQGHILSQEPNAGEPVSDAKVAITLSAGPGNIDLAALQLVGQPVDTAQSLLEKHDLTVRRQEQGDASAPEGQVIGSDPKDSAPVGSTVTLIVSMGDKVQIPPDIQGGPLDAAVQSLEAAGFVISQKIPVSAATIESFNINLQAAGIEDGDVVGIQDNGASFGAWLPPGTSVTLVYYDSSLK
jgi:serine/threonine-protein kinase